MTAKKLFWLDYSNHVKDSCNTCIICGKSTDDYIDILEPDGYDFHDTVKVCEQCFLGDDHD